MTSTVKEVSSPSSSIIQEPSTIGYPEPKILPEPKKPSNCCWKRKANHKHKLTRYDISDSVKAVARTAFDEKKGK